MSKTRYVPRQEVVGSFPVASPFCTSEVRATAGIEFISFRIPYQSGAKALVSDALQAALIGGRAKLPKSARKDWLTLHDPTPQEIQSLIEAHPLGELLELEVRVDFSPRMPVSTLWYSNVRRYLRHGLSPNGHALFTRAVRWRYDPATRRGVRDQLGGSLHPGTLYIRNAAQHAKVRIYQKDLSNGGKREPVVRVEITLNRGGCQLQSVLALGALPSFLVALRRNVGAAFFVARGAKFNPRLTKSKDATRRRAFATANAMQRRRLATGFSKWGAMWCARQKAQLAPDPMVTRLVGGALQRLSRSYRNLELDPKKRNQIREEIRRRSEAILVVSAD